MLARSMLGAWKLTPTLSHLMRVLQHIATSNIELHSACVCCRQFDRPCRETLAREPSHGIDAKIQVLLEMLLGMLPLER